MPKLTPPKDKSISTIPTISELMASDSLSKSGIEALVNSLSEDVSLDNVMRVAAELKAANEFSELMLKKLADKIYNKVRNLPEDDRKAYGLSYVVSSKGKEVSVDHDPEIIRIQADIESVNEEIRNQFGEVLDELEDELNIRTSLVKEYEGAKNPIELDGVEIPVHGAKVISPAVQYVQVRFPAEKKNK